MMRHALHLKFIHHHACNAAAVTTQITTNTETTAIAATTPEPNELEPPPSLLPDVWVCLGMVTVMVGDAVLTSQSKVETVSSLG